MARKQRCEGDSFPCPNCGADVPRGAKFCRACGASDDSGWNEGDDAWEEQPTAGYGEDDEFDYDEFVRREFPEHAEPRPGLQARQWLTIILVVLLCLGMLWMTCWQ